MKRVVSFAWLLMIVGFGNAQGVSKRLGDAVRALENDSQMQSAIVGIYVADQKTGAIVFERNARIGLAIASSQKVITSAASLELLGTGYRYKTELAYDGQIANGTLTGNLYVVGYGDPTLGSWRYGNTKEQVILNKWSSSLHQSGIKQVNGNITAFNRNWESQTIPGGWIWDDIGNYYGAGVSAVNWRENQYDLKLRSGNRAGDKVTIVSTLPKLYHINFTSELTTGKPGSGDNAYIYLPPYATNGFIRGTIPPGENAFTISGSFPNPGLQLTSVLTDEFRKQGIEVASAVNGNDIKQLPDITNLTTHWSPPLDSLNYWFLKKSINLYGEALVKTLGYEKKNEGSTEAGLSLIKDFWKSNGISSTSLNIIDGSGLSPQNHVTAQALVKVMLYARSRPWFSSFYNALPEFNGIKMKSGTIGGVKSFTGYVGGYTFALIINNYNGSSAEMVRKMYRVLDVLK
ncbi:MAG: dacB [Segetibacter sp.]|nr:dacB [Segetibacter sp.]